MLVVGALYYGAMVVCYLLTIVPTHFVEGFKYRDLPVWCWLVSFTFALTPLLWIRPDFRRPSDFTSLFFYACVTVPTMFVPLVASTDDPQDLLPLLVLALICQALLDWSRRGKLVTVAHVSGSLPIFSVLLPIAVIALSLALWSQVGFRISVGFEDVYSRRMEARDALASGPVGLALGYGQSVLLGVLIPSATVIGISLRKPHLLAVSAFSVLAIFSFDGQKVVLFGPIMLAMVTLLTTRTRRNAFFWTAGGFVALCLAGVAQLVLLGDSSFSTYIVRRVVAMPGLLTYYYWDFFSNNPLMMMRDGAIGRVFSRPPYALPVPRIIGAEYLYGPDTNANAGIWAAGFAHFGVAGAVVAPVIAGWILRLVDSISVNGRYVAGCAFCMMLGLIWSNGALHTSLLSNGVLVLVVVLWIFPTSSESGADRHARQAASG